MCCSVWLVQLFDSSFCPCVRSKTFLIALNKLGIDAAFKANEENEIKELEMREQTTNRKVTLRTANTSLAQVVISAFKLTGISDVDAEIKANEIL